MNWQPLGRYILVRLHTKGSPLVLGDDVKYDGLADVIGVGREVEQEINLGDVVLINGPAGIIAHEALGEDIALVAAPLLLAKRGVTES